jgi:addiction module RelE/StbE family toxin
MHFDYSSKFKKKIKKVPHKVSYKFKERIKLFEINQFESILNNHKLHGEYIGYNSINITGNFRAVFKYITGDQVVFYDIGTHPELYG